jgi:putative DNA primase/helicase
MFDALSDFRDAIRAVGLEPPDVMEPGKLHRFPGNGKRSTNRAGWCLLFGDGLGGCFGDWSSDLSETWQTKRDKPYSRAERTAFKRQVADAKAQAEAERKARQADAMAKAATIWNAAAPASDDHPYLVRKGIKANGAHVDNEALLIPMRDGGELHSLQFIEPDGDKRFLSGGRVAGCSFSIGSTQDAAALCIAEGFATGATIHEATGHPVAVAFNTGNLKAVTQALHERFADLTLVICADDDAGTEGNPGLTKAAEAARTVGGLLAVPDFGPDRPKGASDFNDMAQVRGMEAVSDAIKNAAEPRDGRSGISSASQQWPEPQPLAAKVDPEPYPLDALPDTIRAAVQEVQGFTKAPVPLVASSALGALSLVIQAHADAKRAEKLAGPASLFLLTIADSGERKSTCDGFFTRAICEYEEAQAEAAKPALKDHKAAIEAWEAKRGGIKEKTRQLAKESKSTADREKALRDLEHDKPEPPRVPRLLYADVTPEALAYSLAKIWPSGGVVSAEAGIVFGAHGMGKDSVMRNLALLNVLWDGGNLTIDRRSVESFVVRGARLTVALQVQEATLRSFFYRSSGLARGTGFLARFLVAWPESTQGFRPFTEAPANWPALAAFNRRIAAILDRPAPVDEDGALSPPLLALTAEAKAAWVAFHDAIEGELASGGELYDVRDVASKTADNAARIATLLQMFERGGGGAIGLTAFEGASRIAAWHLHEARRFYGELALPKEQADAARLDTWLLDYCRREKTNVIPRREIQRNVTPGHLRQRAALDIALGELVDAGRVRLIQDGRRREIHVNPALLEGGKQ